MLNITIVWSVGPIQLLDLVPHQGGELSNNQYSPWAILSTLVCPNTITYQFKQPFTSVYLRMVDFANS